MDKIRRDPKSRAVLNADAAAYREYLNRRAEHDKVNTLNTKVEHIETELTEIKDLLKLLIAGNNK